MFAYIFHLKKYSTFLGEKNQPEPGQQKSNPNPKLKLFRLAMTKLIVNPNRRGSESVYLTQYKTSWDHEFFPLTAEFRYMHILIPFSQSLVCYIRNEYNLLRTKETEKNHRQDDSNCFTLYFFHSRCYEVLKTSKGALFHSILKV